MSEKNWKIRNAACFEVYRYFSTHTDKTDNFTKKTRNIFIILMSRATGKCQRFSLYLFKKMRNFKIKLGNRFSNTHYSNNTFFSQSNFHPVYIYRYILAYIYRYTVIIFFVACLELHNMAKNWCQNITDIGTF